METCTRNHKRDIAIILSIIFHLLLCVFLFYKIKKTIEEPEAHKFKDEPIFLSQELASQLVEAAKQDKPKEEPVQVDPAVLASQLVPAEQKEEQESVQDNANTEDGQESFDKAMADTQDEQGEEQLQELQEMANKIALETQVIQPKKKIKRRSILQTDNDINVPRLPNVIDYVKEDLKTNLFKLVRNTNANTVDPKYLSYYQKVLNFFERSFGALYAGKSLGIPKHEFTQLEMGIMIDVLVDINSNGTIRAIRINSKSPEFNKCIERAFEHAAPFPNVPKHFNMNTFRFTTQLPIGLQRSGKGLMQVYPT